MLDLIKNYVISVKDDNNNVNRKLILHNESNVKPEDKAIQALVSKILRDSSFSSPDFYSITITKWDNDKATYYINGITYDKKEIQFDTTGTFNIDIRPMKVPSLRSYPSWQEVLRKQQSQKLLGFVWNLMIAPFLAWRDWRKLEGEWTAQTKKDMSSLRHIYSENSPKRLIAALDESISMQVAHSEEEHMGEPEKKLYTMTKFARETGQQVLNLQAKQESLTTLAQETAASIKKNEATIVPTGYYRDGKFYPMLLSFYRKGGQLYCEKFTTDPQARENTHSHRLSYKMNEDQLSDLLEIVWGFQKPSAPIESSKPIEALRTFTGSRLAPPLKSSQPQQDVAELIDSQFITHGALLERGDSKPFLPSKNDPWSLISNWMRTECPETPLGDKLSLLFTVMNHHLDVIQDNFSELSTQELRILLPKIEKRMHKFMRTVNKQFGQEIAYEQLTIIHPLFKNFNNKFSQLAKRLGISREVKEGVNTLMANMDLKEPVSEKISLKLETKTSAKPIGATATYEPVLSQNKELLDSFTTLEKSKFDELTKEVGRLVDVGKYREAVTLGYATLRKLPVPSATKNHWDHLSAQECDAWSEKITELTQCIWESQLKLGENHIWPDQQVELFNSRAILVKLARQKIAFAKSRMKNENSVTAMIRASTPPFDFIICEPGQKEEFHKMDRHDLVLYNTFSHLFLQETRNTRTSVQVTKDIEMVKKMGGDPNFIYRAKERVRHSDLNPFGVPNTEAVNAWAILFKFFTLTQAQKEAFIKQHLNPNYSLDTEFDRLFPEIHEKNPRKLGAICKKEGLSFNEALHLALDGYTFDKEEVMATMALESHLPSLDPLTDKRLAEVYLFFDSSKDKSIRLDIEGVSRSEHEKQFKRKHIELEMGFTDRLQFISYEQINRDGMEMRKLPSSLIDLRKHLFMCQCLLHPESSLYLYKYDKRDQHEVYRNLLLLAQKDSQSPEETAQRLRELHKNAVMENLSKMSRLKLDYGYPSGYYVEPKNRDEKGMMRFSPISPNYLKNIEGYPDHFDSNKNKAALGELPQDITTTMLNDTSKSANERKNLTELWESSRHYLVEERTETAALGDALNVRSRAFNEQYMLSTFGVSQQATGQNPKEQSYSWPEEALEAICQRPDLLEDEKHQRLLESALFKPFVLQRLLHRNPQFILTRIPTIQKHLNNALNNKNHLTAAFLMHIGNHLKQHAKMAAEFQGQNPYLEGFQESKNHIVDKATLAEIVKQMPGYSNEKLSQIEIASPLVATYLLEGYLLEPNDRLLEVYKVLKSSPEQAGMPYLRKIVLDRYENDSTLPKLTEVVKATKHIGTLPQTVLLDPIYSQVFGTQTFPAEAITGEGKEQIYNFNTPAGKQFRIHHDSSMNQTTIWQLIEGKWFEFTSIVGENLSSAEAMIQKHGVWKNEKEIKIIFGDATSWKPSDLAKGILDQEGNLIDVEMTNPSLKVCQDKKGKYTRLLNMVDPSFLLILRDPHSQSPTEIRLLDQGIRLCKQPDGSWKITEGKYAGFQWITDRKKQKTSATADRMIQSLPNYGKQCLLHLSNGKEEKMLVWPHSFEIENNEVKFYQGTNLAAASLKTVLEIGVTEQGELRTTAAGCLYLASLYQAKGDTKRAYHYLKKAISQRITTAAEQRIFEEAMSAIRALPEHTIRMLAFKLKAELAYAKILRQQTQQRVYEPADQNRFFQEKQRIGKLYNEYEERLSKVRRSRPHAVIEEGLELTSDESKEYNFIKHEALVHWLSKPVEAVSAPTPLKISTPKGFSPDFYLYIAALMKKPDAKHPKPDLQAITYLSPDNLLTYFGEYAKEILDKELTPDKLMNLFSAYIPFYSDASEEEKSIGKALEAARETLLTLAALNQIAKTKDHDDPFRKEFREYKLKLDLNRLYQARANIPSELAEGGFRKFWQQFKTYTYSNAFGDIQRNLDDFLKIVNIMPNSTLSLDAAKQQEYPEIFPTTSLAHMEKELESKDCPLSNEEKKAIEQAITQIRKEDRYTGQNRVAESRSVESLLGLLERYGIDLIESHRFSTMTSRIDAREKRLKQKETEPFYAPAHIFIRNFTFKGFELFTSVNTVYPEDAKKNVLQLFSPANQSSMAEEENRLLREGIEPANKTLKTENLQKRTLKKSDIDQQQKLIQARVVELDNNLKELKQEIMDYHDLPEVIKIMKRNPDLYSEAEIFEKLINLYGMGKLNEQPHTGLATVLLSYKLSTKLTEYLIYATEKQQLNLASDELQTLKKMTEGSASYLQQANKIHKTLAAGMDERRYLNDKGEIVNPVFSRKYLVMEYRSGLYNPKQAIILRKSQRNFIEKIVEDPTRMAQLRMGLGKSTVGRPIIMQILHEKGFLPIGLVTDELFAQDVSSMDSITRNFIEQAAMRFEFDLNGPDSPAFLAETYDRILNVKEDGGYLITTLHQIANVENKLTLLAEKRRLLLAENNLEKNRDALIYIQKQLAILSRIRALFHNQSTEKLGFSTQFFADEGDEIFDVTKEDNVALSNRDRPSVQVGNVIRHVLSFIRKGPHQEGSAAFKLQKALQANSQASLTNVDGMMKELAAQTLTPPFTALLPIINLGNSRYKFEGMETDFSEQEWIEYLTKKPLAEGEKAKSELPDWIPPSEYTQLQISVLKRLLSSTLKDTLEQVLDLDLSVSKENGCVIVPRRLKQEMPNTRFGDEIELMLSHELYYSLRGPKRDFLEKVMRKMPDVDAERYASIVSKALAAKLNPIDYLFSPDAWEERLYILDRFVYEEGFVNVPAEQITLNSHDVIRGIPCGAASGTMDPACMPENFERDLLQEQGREIEAETYLRMALSHEKLLNQRVKLVEEKDLMKNMKATLDDFNVKSFLLPGVALEDRDALQIVTELREVSKDRQYIFIGTDAKGERRAMIWNPDQSAPQLYDPELVNNDINIYILDAADTRGTDFPIPLDENCRHILVTGPTTVQSQLVQATWRLRNLGPTQKIEPWLITSVANRISQTQNISSYKITLGHVINDIKDKSIEESAKRHLKTLMIRIPGQAFTKLGDIMFKDDLKRHDVDYWENWDQVYADLEAENAFYVAARDWRIQSKEFNYKAELSPTNEIPPMELLKIIKAKTEQRLNQLKDKLDQSRQSEIDSILDAVTTDFKKLVDAQEQLKKELKPTVPSTQSSNQQTTQHVQQQQRQQEKQRIRAELKDQPLTISTHIYQPPNGAWKTPYGCQSLTALLRVQGIGIENIFLSDEAKRMLQVVPILKGDPLFMFTILKDQTGTYLFVHTKMDYYREMSQACQDADDFNLWVVRSDSPAEQDPDKPFGVTLVEAGSDKGVFDDAEDSLILQVAQLRLLLGFAHFTKQETVVLTSWIQGLSLDQFQQLQFALQAKGIAAQLEFLQQARSQVP